MGRALALCVVVAASLVAAVDAVVIALGIANMSLPRIVWALAVAAWAFYQWRRTEPNVFTGLMIVALVTAGGSLAIPFWDLPFDWYDEYTAYGILLGVTVLSAVDPYRSRLLRQVVWAVPALWALAFGLLAGRPTEDILDWAIVAGATTAILHFVVRRLVDTAITAAAAQQDMVTLHRALSRCSHVLLKDASDSALDEAVEALLQATCADYACVDRTVYDEDIPGFEIVAEAFSRPLPQGADWKSGSYADLPTFLAAHQAGQVCDVRRDELEGEERRLYEEDGIQAELSVPIMIDGTWRGSLAFASFDVPRRWTPTEVDVLVQAADLVAAYWKREDDRRRLEQAIRSKDDLIASVSHELRTPLTAVVGLADEMAASAFEFDPAMMGELAAVVADQSRELAHLVEDLLVAARVESGGLTIRCTEVRLLTEAQVVVDAVGGGASITVEGWDGVALADPLRCRQIIRNLVTNALRYGGQEIVVSVFETGDGVHLTVSDDGPGVPEADAESIFEPYVRSQQIAPGSVGVGLAVSRNLSELMGGALEYRRDEGRTTFCLILPHVPSIPDLEHRMDSLAAR